MNWCVLEVNDKWGKVVHIPHSLTKSEAKRIAKCMMVARIDRKSFNIRLFVECPCDENGPDAQYAYRRFKELKEYFGIS